MKKLLTVTLALLLSCAALFAACDDKKDDPPPEPQETETVEGMEVVSAEEINTFDTDALRLFGRTYMQQKMLEAELVPMTEYLYYRAFVDGDTEGTIRKLTGNRPYVLAKNLEEGVHTVRLVKSISSQNGVIRVSKLTTDGKFLRPAKKDRLRVEFVGDSITVGAGIFGDTTGKGCTVDNSDAAKCYAYLTAQALDADYSIVATEGICVKKEFVLPFSMMDMYEQLSSVTTGKYSYPEESHDLVVVALGTNDGSYMGRDSSYTREVFAQDYGALLDLIRSKNPQAKIVCVYGMMFLNSAVENGIQDAIAQQNDPTITYLRLPTDTKGADSHPSLEGAKQQSEALLAYLNEIL